MTKGDKGRDLIFSRGDVTPILLFYYKSYNRNFNFGAFLKIGEKIAFLKDDFRNLIANCLMNIE